MRRVRGGQVGGVSTFYRAVFTCNLEVQFEVNSELAKDIFQARIRTGSQMRRYIEFGGKWP